MKIIQAKLGEFLEFKNGKKPSTTNGQYPIYGGNGIMGFSSITNAPTDTIVIGRVGANCGSVYLSDEECWISDNAIIALPKDRRSTAFFYYLLKSMKLNRSRIGTSQPLLTQGSLVNVEVRIPETSEDRSKIGNFLKTIDSKININTLINKNLTSQLQILFSHFFEQNCESMGWPEKKIDELLILKHDKTKADSQTSLPYLPIDLIPTKSLALDSVLPGAEAKSSLQLFQKNDILIGAMRVYFHRVTIAPFNGITRNTCFVLSPKDENQLYYLLIYCFQDSTISYAQRTSKSEFCRNL